MIKYWSCIQTEISRELSVAKSIMDKGYEICQLVEIRFIRHSRHAKRKRTVEVNLLPGKVIALFPDIAFEEIPEIPHASRIIRDAQGSPWRIPDPQVSEFAETVSALNSGEWARIIDEAERDNQARMAKKRKKWQKLKDGLKSLGGLLQSESEIAKN
jgi:hypothetical protein